PSGGSVSRSHKPGPRKRGRPPPGPRGLCKGARTRAGLTKDSAPDGTPGAGGPGKDPRDWRWWGSLLIYTAARARPPRFALENPSGIRYGVPYDADGQLACPD